MITIPPTIRVYWPKLRVWYVTKCRGSLTHSQEPIDDTSVRHEYLAKIRLLKWPIRFEIELGGRPMLDCLFDCGEWFRKPNMVRLWRGECKLLKTWYLPYRWWSWKVLIRSKKLCWKNKLMWRYK